MPASNAERQPSACTTVRPTLHGLLFACVLIVACLLAFEVNYALVVAALAPFLWLMWPQRTRAPPLNPARGPANAATASLPNDIDSDKRIDLLGRTFKQRKPTQLLLTGSVRRRVNGWTR